MATWHQQRRPVRLYHDTLWTVVSDPPNGMRTLITCASKEQAEAWAANDPNAYVLKPAKEAQDV